MEVPGHPRITERGCDLFHLSCKAPRFRCDPARALGYLRCEMLVIVGPLLLQRLADPQGLGRRKDGAQERRGSLRISGVAHLERRRCANRRSQHPRLKWASRKTGSDIVGTRPRKVEPGLARLPRGS